MKCRVIQKFCVSFLSLITLSTAVFPAIQGYQATLQSGADAFDCFWGDSEGVVLGFSAAYFEGKSVEECMLECLKAGLGGKFVCKSIAYFNTQPPECSLSQESKQTRPDIIIRKDVRNSTPHYYENRCLPRNFFGHDPLYSGEVFIRGRIGNIVGQLIFSQASSSDPVYVTGIVTDLPLASVIVVSMYVKSRSRDAECAQLANSSSPSFVEKGNAVRKLIDFIPRSDGVLIIPLQATDLKILGPLGALQSVVMVEQRPSRMENGALVSDDKSIIACGITTILSNHTYEELAGLVPVDDLMEPDEGSSGRGRGSEWKLVLGSLLVVLIAYNSLYFGNYISLSDNLNLFGTFRF